MGATKEQCSSLVTHHPLFSIAATSILIAFLYVPRPLLTLIFSPALIATLLLLAALHRFGSSAPQAPQHNTSTPPPSSPIHQSHQQQQQQQQQKPVVFRSDLVEWERPAGWPLDVIHEEYEGVDSDSSENSAVGLGPFGLCFADSNSESDDDDGYLALEGRDSLEFLCFRWDEEGDGMIEIDMEEEEEEEDNLIEIDISGCR